MEEFAIKQEIDIEPTVLQCPAKKPGETLLSGVWSENISNMEEFEIKQEIDIRSKELQCSVKKTHETSLSEVWSRNISNMEECVIKQEIDIEPTVLQQPDIYYTLGTIKIEQVEPGEDTLMCSEHKLSQSVPNKEDTVKPAQDWYLLVERSPKVLCQKCRQNLLVTSEVQQNNHICNISRNVRGVASCDFISSTHTNCPCDSKDPTVPKISTVGECESCKNERFVRIRTERAAQYNPEYRARKRALKNANFRIVDHNDTLTLIKVPKTPAERTRECRARKIALENAHIQSLDLNETKTLIKVSSTTPAERTRKKKRLPKTPAERTRECRARKKASENARIQSLDFNETRTLIKEPPITPIVRAPTKKRVPKTPAERTRKCRARKKALENAANKHLIPFSSTVIQADGNQLNSSSESVGHIRTLEKTPKTPAERAHECKTRKKALEKSWQTPSN